MEEKTMIKYTMDDDGLSELVGSMDDIAIGLAHLVCTFGYDSSDDHNRDKAEGVIKATLQYIQDVYPLILDEFYSENIVEAETDV